MVMRVHCPSQILNVSVRAEDVSEFPILRP